MSALWEPGGVLLSKTRTGCQWRVSRRGTPHSLGLRSREAAQGLAGPKVLLPGGARRHPTNFCSLGQGPKSGLLPDVQLGELRIAFYILKWLKEAKKNNSFDT